MVEDEENVNVDMGSKLIEARTELVLPSGHIVLFDEADSGLILRYSWYANPQPNGVVYPQRKFIELGVNRSQYMHTLLMNPPDGMKVVHVNYNGLDNRRENLRICTPAQSRIHARPSIPRTYKGVHVVGNRYRARITVDGRMLDLGSYYKSWDAALAYNRAALEYYGDLAYLNTRHYEGIQ
jgi:hypothetical protein